VCRLIVGIGLAARPFHPLARRLVRIVGRETARFALARRAARRLRSAGRAELTVRDCSFCTPVVWTVALWPRSGVAKHT
jgi:hypothetical protein